MPSSFSHAAVGFTVAYVALPRPKRTTGMLWAAACCAALPDLDNIGVLFGHPDLADYLGGHRGFTHSFFFAALLGLLVAYRAGALKGVVIAAATASHGLLDAFTTQGPGIAFLS
ncbi:MAG: metal-dependent hydrolase, partial [Gemmatimonadales bacterium]